MTPKKAKTIGVISLIAMVLFFAIGMNDKVQSSKTGLWTFAILGSLSFLSAIIFLTIGFDQSPSTTQSNG